MRHSFLPMVVFLLIAVCVSIAPPPVSAGPNAEMGTVVSVGVSDVTWRSDSGEERTVTLDGVSTARSKLHSGDRVMVHYHPAIDGSNQIVTMTLQPGKAMAAPAEAAPAVVRTDLDSDGDGVTDSHDRCADTQRGCTVDGSGCPADSDGDGVCDGLDRCAGTPRGAAVDAAGCPQDSDGDGVYNGLDRCADTPQGSKVDKFGCPITAREQKLIETGTLRLEGVKFQTGKAVIDPSSYATLDEAGATLMKYPDLRVEIGGHTDSKGSATKNQTLSEGRARAVREYLLSKFPGLNVDNLTAVGFGPTVPVADNNSDSGRAENRRVEFQVKNPEVLR